MLDALSDVAKHTLLVVGALFPIVNPIGNTPIFLSLTRGLSTRGRTVLASVLGTTEKQKEKLASLLQNRDVLMGFAHNQTGGVVDEWLASPEPKKTAAAQILHASIELPKGMFLELPANIEAFKTDSILAAEIFVDGNTTKTAV